MLESPEEGASLLSFAEAVKIPFGLSIEELKTKSINDLR